ncbi:hypothetical protein IV203_000661 [Nitzschia inconspicua]|uniref:Uncharacterized protein n=1 Tax=Nitzschia inconspicua TaxID=303405 RepID=A0A9K3PQ66_9STRA|nr:hypothetical protein IV203_000661 [Nitzschia inconspicua]
MEKPRLVSLVVTFLFLLMGCSAYSLPPIFQADSHGNKFSSADSARRQILSTGLAPLAWNTLFPSQAIAAEPIQSRDTDSLLAIVKRKLRPKPPKLLRRKLSQDFAVLLMRSSYNALDELDCVAMDQFQRDFFLIRSSEYQDYTNALGDGMVQQGDLTDPYYFDFISFAQYYTINRELTQYPPFVFQEMQPSAEQTDNGKSNFVPVVVRRDPSLTNEMLIPTHSSKVGSAILDRLEETFGDTESRIPRLGIRPDPASLLSAIQKLLNLFLINGYAFKGDAVMSSPTATAVGTNYHVTLQAPAILWGGRVLQSEGQPLSNDFLLKAVAELIGRSGYRCTSSTKFDGVSEEITVTII